MEGAVQLVERENAVVEQENASFIKKTLFDAFMAEKVAEMEKAEREAIGPCFDGIYVSKDCTKIPRVYGFFHPGWRRAYIQFFSDGAAFYHNSVVTRFELPTEALFNADQDYFKSIVKQFPRSSYTWEMRGGLIIIKDQSGSELLSKIEADYHLKVVDPTNSIPPIEYSIVETQLKLR